jgi:hypothetical protein
MARVTIEMERDDAVLLLEALDASRARAMAAADAAQARHDEDGRLDCCEEAGALRRAYDRLRAALGGN